MKPTRAKHTHIDQPQPQQHTRTRKCHLQQRGGDAAVADVVARAHGAALQQRLHRAPHALELPGLDVGALVAELGVCGGGGVKVGD
jgi:hypothetical protein